MPPKLLLLAWIPAVVTLASCTSTLPSAAKLDEYEQQLRAQAQKEYDALDRALASGEISRDFYEVEKANIDQRIVDDARDAAWSRHSLAQSERKSIGVPTPDLPVAVSAPNPMYGGTGGMGIGGYGSQGTLYRPFSQNAQGIAPVQFGTSSLTPNYSRINNAGTRYTAPVSN